MDGGGDACTTLCLMPLKDGYSGEFYVMWILPQFNPPPQPGNKRRCGGNSGHGMDLRDGVLSELKCCLYFMDNGAVWGKGSGIRELGWASVRSSALAFPCLEPACRMPGWDGFPGPCSRRGSGWVRVARGGGRPARPCQEASKVWGLPVTCDPDVVPVVSPNRKGRFHCPGSWRVFLSNSEGTSESRAKPECSHGVRDL